MQHPFEYGVFVRQLVESGTTVTAMPSAILAELGANRVLKDPRCKLRRVGRVWSPAELADLTAPLNHMAAENLSRPVFDLYPLGDLASSHGARRGALQFPDKLLVVREIPRDAKGNIDRAEILARV